MCHQSVGLVQNIIEARGIPTVTVSLKPEITMGVGVPRAGVLRFPLGNPVGEAFAVELQRSILIDLLDIFRQAEEPGVVFDLPYRWRRGRISS